MSDLSPIQTIIWKVGHSNVITISPKVMELYGLKIGDSVLVSIKKGDEDVKPGSQ